ncbi:MAG: sugar transferase [Coriobacteriales bacterium]
MYRLLFKRLFDIMGSLAAMPFVLTLLAFLVPLIKLEDNGPAFYNAPRMGKDGRMFTMYKLRSMYVNAPDIKMADGSTYNAPDDPRMTRMGAFLRRTSLDEVPQFFNVLKGDMSIVGPRPDLKEESELWEGEEKLKGEVLPGITGFAQVYGRNSIPWKKRLKLDAYYVRHVSPALDAGIVLKTVGSIFKQEGIYNDPENEGGAGDMAEAGRPRIAVITMGVKLGDETKGYTRFLSVCETLANAGYDVELITSSFQHWEKAQRDLSAFPHDRYPFKVSFIHESGYSRNLDVKRILSHAEAARNLTAHLETSEGYDLVYFEVPPNDVALAAATYAEERGIPAIADINDLWPEAMRMALDVPVVSDILFSKFASDARELYKRLAAVVGTSDEYATRPFTDCDPSIEHVTVYVGNDIPAFDEAVAANADSIEKPNGEFWVMYTGTLGASYDIATMIDASAIMKAHGYGDVRIMILGDGPDRAMLEERAASCDCNVEFLGYQPYEMMAAYLSKCDVTVNSLVAKAPQSIVTKIGDYLACGKPMINTGMSPEFRGKVEGDGFGINIIPEDPEEFAAAVIALHDSPEACASMGEVARRIAVEQFDRAHSYQRIVELVERTLSNAE